jgi:hypothetical protein
LDVTRPSNIMHFRVVPLVCRLRCFRSSERVEWAY